MKKILIILFGLFSPAVFAADTFSNEFYVYGSFDSVVNGFTRIALIFHNSDYSILLYVIVFLAILVGTAISLGREALGTGNGKQTFSMFVIPLFGVALFKVMMTPTSTMHIYDPTHNRYQSVGSVPALIAYVANGVNLLERFSTQAFNTSTTTRDKHANGTTLKLFLDFAYNDPISNNHYLKTNISNFLEVCLPVGITSQNYTFDFDTFQTNTTDILAYMANLKSTSNYMTYYSPTIKKGDIIDCATGYERIHTILISPATFADHMKSVCEKSGFDTSTPAALNLCKTRIDEISDLVLDSTVNISANQLAASQVIANSLYELMADSKGSAIAAIGNKRQMTEGLGNIIVAEGWLPTMRYNTMIIILSITPFFTLMFLTPMLFKSLHMLVTMFIFIGIWGLIDSVMHDIIFDQVLDMMLELKNKGGGIQAMLMVPNELQKAVAMFGKQQSIGVGLATLLTAIFFKFSGHAFANMGEKLGNDVDRIGNDAGRDTLDPNSNINQMEGYAGASAKHNLHNNIGTENFKNASGFNAQRDINNSDQFFKGMEPKGYSTDESMKMYSQKAGGNLAGSLHATKTRADLQDQTLTDYSNKRGEIDTHHTQAQSEFTESLLPSTNNGEIPQTPQEIANASSTLVGIEKAPVKASVIANEGSSQMATSVATVQARKNIGDAAAISKLSQEKEQTVDQYQENISNTQLRGATANSDAVKVVAAETNQSEQDLQDRNALQTQMEQHANTHTTDSLQSKIGSSKLDTVKAQKGQAHAVLNDEQANNLSKNTGAVDVGSGVYDVALDSDSGAVSTQARTGDSAHINDDHITSAKDVIDTSDINKDDHITSSDRISSAKNVTDTSTTNNSGRTDTSGYYSQNMAVASLPSEERVDLISNAIENGQFNNMIDQLSGTFLTKETLTDNEGISNTDELILSAGVGGSISMGDSSSSTKTSPLSSGSKSAYTPIRPNTNAFGQASTSKPSVKPKANLVSAAMSAMGIEANVRAGADYNKRMSDTSDATSSISVDKYQQILMQAKEAAEIEYNHDSHQVAVAVNEAYEQLLDNDHQRVLRDIDTDFNPIGETMDYIEDKLPDSMKDALNKFDDEPDRSGVDLR